MYFFPSPTFLACSQFVCFFVTAEVTWCASCFSRKKRLSQLELVQQHVLSGGEAKTQVLVWLDVQPITCVKLSLLMETYARVVFDRRKLSFVDK